MSFSLQAQNTAVVHGYVTDSVSREPIPYATVRLLDSDAEKAPGGLPARLSCGTGRDVRGTTKGHGSRTDWRGHVRG